ncbi:hypothetical protein quinque_002725 [Culex quinquefasciatus]
MVPAKENALLADGLRSFTKLNSLKSLKMVRTKKPKVAITGVKKNGGEHKMLVKNNKPIKSLIRKSHRPADTLKLVLLPVPHSRLVQRVLQNYVIVTKTRVDLCKAKISKHINDGFFC